MGKPWWGREKEVEDCKGDEVKTPKDVEKPKDVKTPKDVKKPKDVKTPKGGSSKDVKTATERERPRKPRKSSKSCDADIPSDTPHGWRLPSAGVGERCVNGVICVDPAIEEAMRNSWPPVVKEPEPEEFAIIREREEVERAERVRERRDALRRERERGREERQRKEAERERRDGDGEEDVEADQVAETERRESWWRGARRRVSKLGGKGSGSAGSSPEEVPEEANEYTPSRAASPDMIVEARTRAAAAPTAEAEPGPAPGIAPREIPKHISAAEKARALVENEPHSPGWNGSTYVDGREHHYCGLDFPCQMEPQCNPSIRDLWDKGVPVTPDLSPKRAPFGAPVRALLGIKKQPWPPEPKYRKPACVQSIRIGNSADTTIIDEPLEGCNLGSFAVEADRVPTPDERGEAEKAESGTMRRLKKFWGFWTYYGGKMAGSRRPVIMAQSEESFVVAEPDQGITASRAAANFAASACYPVGESTVETAKPIERVDSGTQTPEGNEEAKKSNANTGTTVKE
ncbi:hypothetical protein V496_04854 [Pseudogymnoascus sp. VKM F-4515 (FW-2607)]|nr:hypothetical protein V496_04854 [Pseudogymnoascus sp. VKM F-4515 (FW-2607)]